MQKTPVTVNTADLVPATSNPRGIRDQDDRSGCPKGVVPDSKDKLRLIMRELVAPLMAQWLSNRHDLDHLNMTHRQTRKQARRQKSRTFTTQT